VTTMTTEQRAREAVEEMYRLLHDAEIYTQRGRQRLERVLREVIDAAETQGTVREREACEQRLLHARNEHLRLREQLIANGNHAMSEMQKIRAEECDLLAEAIRTRQHRVTPTDAGQEEKS